MFAFFKKIKSALSKKIKALFSQPPDDSAFEHLEQIFFEADLGASLSAELVDKVRTHYKKNGPLTSDQILSFVKEELLKFCMQGKKNQEVTPKVILMVGVNGSGKTTTLAKLANIYTAQGKKVLVAAADTFRAAAVEQLEKWVKKIGADLVKSKPNSDPSGVAFDALDAAVARKSDVVLIDTAGRLQTKTDLMQELAKIYRICKKKIPEAPHETLLVIDATMGQNAIDQAMNFHAFSPVTGIVLTKLDGTAKGGIALAIQKQMNIPILWVGLGEGLEDFQPFDAESFVSELLS